MAMNRQQRRIMAKRSRMYREVADEYEKEVSAYKDRIDSTVIEQFFVAAGMALHNLYGWKANGIGRFWREMDRIICDYQNDEDNFYNKIRYFIDAVKTGGKAPVPSSQILYNQAIIDGIARSAKLGREVEINIPEI